MIFFLLITFLYSYNTSIYPQYQVFAKQAQDRMNIDGALDEFSWNFADSISNLTQIEPNAGKPAEYKSLIRILYDSEFLFIGGICYSKKRGNPLRVSDFKRDFIFEESDGFGIILDLFNDRRNAAAFFINPLSAQRDLMVFDEKIIDENWNTKWYAATNINESGWIFEIAIPWSSIRYSSSTDSFGVNFIRLDRNSNELSAWVPYPRTYSMFRLNYGGHLFGIKTPSSRNDIRFTPYLLIQNNNLWERLNSKLDFSGNKIKPGGEVKWTINSSTFIDLTLNTDFAQADVDRKIINLTRFDILFPERRQFFLESAGLFKAGNADGIIEPFFSRRIGLDDSGNPIPLDGGIRLVHRDLLRNYGVLAAHTHIPDSSKSLFVVGRFSQNYGEQNRIGFLTTYRKDDFNSGQNKNFVGAADGYIRLNDNLSINWLLSGSGYLQYNQKKFYGFSEAASVSYLTENINLFFKNYLVSKNYNVESGFITAKNIAAIETGTDLYLRPVWKPGFVRDFEPALYLNFYFDWNSGKLRQFFPTVWPVYILFQNGAVVSAKWLPTWENVNDAFALIDSITLNRGEYFFNRYEFRIASDPSESLRYSLLYSTGGYYDGQLKKFSAQIKYTPIANISLSVNYEPNWLSGNGILNSNKKIEIVSADLNLALNTKVILTGFYQYNSEDKSNFTYLKFAWEYSPLSYLYVLYNIGTFKGILKNEISQILLMIKISYQFQL